MTPLEALRSDIDFLKHRPSSATREIQVLRILAFERLLAKADKLAQLWETDLQVRSAKAKLDAADGHNAETIGQHILKIAEDSQSEALQDLYGTRLIDENETGPIYKPGTLYIAADDEFTINLIKNARVTKALKGGADMDNFRVRQRRGPNEDRSDGNPFADHYFKRNRMIVSTWMYQGQRSEVGTSQTLGSDQVS